MEQPRGYLYRRAKGKRLPIESASPATIYLDYDQDGRRYTLCLHTADRRRAEQLARERLGALTWSDREAYLHSLIEAGERAKRELYGLQHIKTAATLEQVWDRYLTSRRRPNSGPSTLSHYEQEWKAFAAWAHAGSTSSMTRVSPTMAEEYVRHLEARLNPATVAHHIATLRRIWRVCAPDAPSPWADLRPAGIHTATPYRRLTLDECRRIATTAADAEILRLFMIGYYTGLRLVDAVSIRAEHITADFATMTIPAPHKTTRRKPEPLTIPIMPELSGQIATAIGAGDYLCPRLQEMHGRAKGSVSDAMTATFRRAKVGNTPEGHASFHSLRATFVTFMDEAGAPSRLTGKITGHAPRSMHERYSHPDIEAARTWMTKALPTIFPLDITKLLS